MFQSLRVKLIKYLIDVNEHFIFEKRLRKAYLELTGNKLNTIIDVGANKGQSIDFFKKANPACKIFAFEPNKTLYQLLLSKYKADKQIEIVNMGVSDKLGERIFNQNVLDYTSTFEDLNEDSEYLKKKARVLGVKASEIVTDSYSVETTTLSHFINTTVNEPIDVLKIDVEGHEYACLKGLFEHELQFPIRYIQLEQHNDDMYANKIPFDSITKLLNDNGFFIKETIRHGFGDLDELIFANRRLEKQG